MPIVNFELYLSYSQLCIFSSSLDNPFNDWSDRSVSQGFAWRESSASFRSINESGSCRVNMYVEEVVPDLDQDVCRAFRVPFLSL